MPETVPWLHHPLMVIRPEHAGDRDTVYRLHAAAFGRDVEARLVDQLRADPSWIAELSLVAEIDGGVAGHVVCSRATVGAASHPVLALGPLGVVPGRQGIGIGSALVHAAIAAADQREEALIVLLGAPGYYQRFGFILADLLGIEPPQPEWTPYLQARRLAA